MLLKETIASQYANSPRLMKILLDICDSISVNEQIKEFYDLVMNVHTARRHGLDVWGRIVGMPRSIGIEDGATEFFGFSDGFYPFNQRPFASSGTDAFELSDEAYRQLILVKAAANIIDCTAPNINKLMKSIFEGKKCYFIFIRHMKARFVFEFSLTPFERFLVHDTNLLPRPAGVEIETVDAIPPETFGFYGTGFSPFNAGVFYAG